MFKSYSKKSLLFFSAALAALAVSFFDLTSTASAQNASQPTIIKLKEIKLIGRKTLPKTPSTQGSTPSATSNNITLKEIKLIGRKGTPQKNKTYDLGSFKIELKPALNKTYDLGSFKIEPKPALNKTYDLGSFKIEPKPALNKTYDLGSFKIEPKPALNKTYDLGSFKIEPKSRSVTAQSIILNWLPEPALPGDKTAKAADIVIIGKRPADLAQTRNEPRLLTDSKTATARDIVITGKRPADLAKPLTTPRLLAGSKSVIASDIIITGKGNPGAIPTPRNVVGSRLTPLQNSGSNSESGLAQLPGAPGAQGLNNLPPISENITVTAPNIVLTSKNAPKGPPDNITVTAPNIVLTSKNAPKGPPENITVTAPNIVLTSKNAPKGPPENITVTAPNIVLTSKNAPEKTPIPDPAKFARDGRVTAVDVGELKFIGAAKENKFTINGGELRVVGDRPARAAVQRPTSLPGRVKVSLIRVRKLSGETNPFDPVEVEADVTAAQNGTLNATALTLTTAVPTAFTNNLPASVTIEADGPNRLAAEVPGVILTNLDVLADDVNGIYQMIPNGMILLSNSGNGGLINPNNDLGVPTTLVLQRGPNGTIYQITINVEGDGNPANTNTRITQLSGFNCGTSVSNCP